MGLNFPYQLTSTTNKCVTETKHDVVEGDKKADKHLRFNCVKVYTVVPLFELCFANELNTLTSVCAMQGETVSAGLALGNFGYFKCINVFVTVW